MSDSIIDLGKGRVGRRVGGSLGLKTVPDGFSGAMLQFTSTGQSRWVHASRWFFNLVVGTTADVTAGIADHDSVQDAIDAAASSDSIYLLENTYTENLVIAKKLVIWGEGNDTRLDGTVQWSTGAEEGLTKYLTFAGNLTVDNTVTGLIVTDCWLATGITLTDNNAAQDDNNFFLLEEV